MSTLLQRLLNSGHYMAPASDDELSGGSGGSADDRDLDEDDDDDIDAAADKLNEVKTGEQEDGSYVVEEEDDKKTEAEDGEPKVETGEDENDREKIREARRLERQQRKQRQKDKEESTKRELAAERESRKALEARLAALEGRDRSREIAGVDDQIKRTAQVYNNAKKAYEEAIEQHDGAAATAALEEMNACRDNYGRLNTAKKAYEQQQQAPKGAADPRIVNHAQRFMSENSWYKHGSDDVDSTIVATIDSKMVAEGWDPSTQEYWDELRARTKKYLPHRISGGKVSTTDNDVPNKQQKGTSQQKKAVVGGGGGETQGGGKGVFKLSADRVKAMKDAGMWDDPKQRAEAIASYRSYDKQNSKGN